MMFKFISRLSLFTLLFSITMMTFAQDSLDNTQDDTQQLYQEYMQLSQRLQIVQQQALQDEEISEKSTEFAKNVEEEMLKKDPSVKEKIDQRNKIIDDFQQAQQVNDQEKLVRLQQEYQSVSQELMPHEQQAMENEALQQQGAELERIVIAKMEEIDPEVPQLRERLQTLNQELQQKQQ